MAGHKMIALIHWRIKPESVEDFLTHWREQNRIADRSGLIAEFLSDSLKPSDMPFITWHLDEQSLGNFRSYVTVGIWVDGDAFAEQIGQYFNDENALLPFEQYRRRRVVFRPVEWRIGNAELPETDTPGVL
ncbi:hypothetical protein [Erythrobacter sp.]|uniref:hypothetical protein n=1 Tax=Erythrobacter sp. TaxID=1042 RepID=UPI001B08A4CC|nr:hypothetical protein [Erythrobacter sp.]MBO6528398.1 hypothetical protein [Erythrobacter sp.]MBO6531301.1 hypothetical protein [Erythrobacter sp.]